MTKETKTPKTKQVKAPSNKKAEMQAKKKVFLAALVAAYGEGAAITRKQMVTVYNTNKEAFPHFGMVKRDANYKLGRNRFVVTTSENPAAVRDKTMENLAKLQDKKESTLLPKSTRKSAAKLLKAVAPEAGAESDELETAEADSAEDINNLLRTIG